MISTAINILTIQIISDKYSFGKGFFWKFSVFLENWRLDGKYFALPIEVCHRLEQAVTHDADEKRQMLSQHGPVDWRDLPSQYVLGTLLDQIGAGAVYADFAAEIILQPNARR
jgi:hypothetical protein